MSGKNPTVKEQLAALRAGRTLTANSAPAQLITQYIGVPATEVEDFAVSLVEGGGFAINVNAMAKGQGLVAQVQSATKPTCVFNGWESGKAMVTGTLPAGVAVPSHWIAA